MDKPRLTRMGNRLGVWLYRVLDGRLSSAKRGVQVLVVTSPGRVTGRPRSTCVRYLKTADGYLVWGTGSGSTREPDWFRNLRSTETADVQVGAHHRPVRRRELLGPERERVWRDVVLAEAPEVARYAARAGRTIPVALLTPIGDDRP